MKDERGQEVKARSSTAGMVFFGPLLWWDGISLCPGACRDLGKACRISAQNEERPLCPLTHRFGCASDEKVPA